MDVVPRRYTKTNYEIIDVGYKAPVCKPESELARQNAVKLQFWRERNDRERIAPASSR